MADDPEAFLRIRMPILAQLPLEEIRAYLQHFDESGMGDNDGRIEYADLDPNPLASKFHYYAQFFSHDEHGHFHPLHNFSLLSADQQQKARQVSALWTNLEELRQKMMGAQKTESQKEELTRVFGLKTAEEVNHPVDPHQGIDDSGYEAHIQQFIRSTWKHLQSFYTRDPQGGFWKQEFWETEDVHEHPIMVLGDSLTAGMKSASVKAASDSPAMASYVLTQFGVQSPRIRNIGSNIGFEKPFPFDADALIELRNDVMNTTLEMGWNLLVGAKPVYDGARNSRVIIMGVPGATTHDIIADLSQEEDWRSPGRVFMDPLMGLYPEDPQNSKQDRSFLQFAIQEFKRRMQKGERGGSFVVGLGSNNLMSFHQFMLAAPDHDPALYEADLIRLDQKTKELTERGTRRIYLFPPDVRNLLVRIPEQAHFVYEDGSPIPIGSYVLFHWYVGAGEHGVSIPKKNVMSPEEYSEFGRRFQAMNTIAHRVLEQQSNWLIIDNDRKQSEWKSSDPYLPGVFSYLMQKANLEGIRFDNVPGYGTVTYQGREEMLSNDNIHPSDFAYLFWSDLLAQSFVNHGISSPHYTVYEDLEDARPELLLRVYQDMHRRVGEELRKNPSAWRPKRMQYERLKTWRENLQSLAHEFENGKIKPSEVGEKNYALLNGKWPYFNRETLVEMLQVTEISPSHPHDISPRLKEHQLVELIKDQITGLSAEQKASVLFRLFQITDDFSEKMEKGYWDQTRLMTTFFDGMGPRGSERVRDHHEGKTPGVFAPLLVQAEAAAFVASADDLKMRFTLGLQKGTSAGPFLSAPLLNYVSMHAFIRGSGVFSATEFDYGEIALGAGLRTYHEGLPLSLALEASASLQSNQPTNLKGRSTLRFSYHPSGQLFLGTPGGELFVEGGANFDKDRLVLAQGGYRHNF